MGKPEHRQRGQGCHQQYPHRHPDEAGDGVAGAPGQGVAYGVDHRGAGTEHSPQGEQQVEGVIFETHRRAFRGRLDAAQYIDSLFASQT
ncbi:hypothetical protein D3C79_1025080 [compost metagenome]